MQASSPFGQWLRARRKALDLTQAALAGQVGCAPVTLRQFEAGKRRPSAPMAARLADCLQVAPDEREAFLAAARHGTEEEPAPPSPAATPPAPLTSLLGRADLVVALRQRLADPAVRLLTLTGPPGVGKTRLALAVAEAIQEGLSASPCPYETVCWVALASVTDAALVVPTVARTVGVPKGDGEPLAVLSAWLQARAALLVLDNFEQVLNAAPAVGTLLEAAPQLKVLATSRERLHLYGEHEWSVPPLGLPEQPPLDSPAPARITAPTLPRIARTPAVQLFVERAQAANATFALTSHNAQAVASLCIYLEGMPLAIELAAARSKALPPAALLARMTEGGRLDALASDARNLPPRQRTLRGAIAWSYALLDPAEQALFRQLGVFVGGASEDAIKAVNGAEQPSLSEGLASLVDKSLIQRATGVDGMPRFTLLETLREYAGEQLGRVGEVEAARERHARYFLDLAEASEAALQGAEQAVWLQRLEQEHPNLRAALDWSLDSGQVNAELPLCLSVALWRFWWGRGHLTEGRGWLERAAARRSEVAPSLQARVLNRLGNTAWAQGDYEMARIHHEASLTLWQHIGDHRKIAASLSNLGIVAIHQGDYESARFHLEAALTIQRQLDVSLTAVTLNNLGLAACYQEDFAAARLFYEQSLAVEHEQNNLRGIATVLNNLGDLALRQADFAAARTSLAESLTRFEALGSQSDVSLCLEGFAELAYKQGELARSVCLFVAATRLRQQSQSFANAADQSRYDALLRQSREVLDSTAFDAAQSKGQAMTLKQAIAFTLNADQATPRRLPSRTRRAALPLARTA